MVTKGTFPNTLTCSKIIKLLQHSNLRQCFRFSNKACIIPKLVRTSNLLDMAITDTYSKSFHLIKKREPPPASESYYLDSASKLVECISIVRCTIHQRFGKYNVSKSHQSATASNISNCSIILYLI